MNFMLQLKKQLVNFINNKYIGKYLVLVIFSVCIEYFTYYTLITFVHISYVISNIVSICVAFFINWLAGRYFIFGNSKKYLNELVGLIFFTFISFAAQMTTIIVAVEIFIFNPYIAKGIGLAVSFALNLFFRIKYIYKEECRTH